MNLVVITDQLHKQGPTDIKGIVCNPQKINKCIILLKNNSIQNNEISIYDITRNNDLKKNKILPVNNHINKTGHNPLIGRQKQLGINFTDLTNIYSQHTRGIITECFGERPPKNATVYPSAYLCYISILARAMGCLKINGFLVNIV